jgi:hypothetical protein
MRSRQSSPAATKKTGELTLFASSLETKAWGSTSWVSSKDATPAVRARWLAPKVSGGNRWGLPPFMFTPVFHTSCSRLPSTTPARDRLSYSAVT